MGSPEKSKSEIRSSDLDSSGFVGVVSHMLGRVLGLHLHLSCSQPFLGHVIWPTFILPSRGRAQAMSGGYLKSLTYLV